MRTMSDILGLAEPNTGLLPCSHRRLAGRHDVLPHLFAHPSIPLASLDSSITLTDKTETPISIDIVADIRRLNDLSIKSRKAGMIILGGGVCKHQIANSMLFVSPIHNSTTTHH